MAEISTELATTEASPAPIDYSSRSRSRLLTSTAASYPHQDSLSDIPHTYEPGRVGCPPLQILELASTILSSDPKILETYGRWWGLQKQLHAIIASCGIRTAGNNSVELIHRHIERCEPVAQGKLTMLVQTELGSDFPAESQRRCVFELRQMLDAEELGDFYVELLSYEHWAARSKTDIKGSHPFWTAWCGVHGLQVKIVEILGRTPATKYHTLAVDVKNVGFGWERRRNSLVAVLIQVRYCLDYEDWRPAERSIRRELNRRGLRDVRVQIERVEFETVYDFGSD